MILPNFLKNYMKLKEFGPKGGARPSLRTVGQPLSASSEKSAGKSFVNIRWRHQNFTAEIFPEMSECDVTGSAAICISPGLTARFFLVTFGLILADYRQFDSGKDLESI